MKTTLRLAVYPWRENLGGLLPGSQKMRGNTQQHGSSSSPFLLMFTCVQDTAREGAMSLPWRHKLKVDLWESNLRGCRQYNSVCQNDRMHT
jgi:hypothetical protein